MVLEDAGDEEDEADSLIRLLPMKGAGPVVAAELFGEASDLLVGGTFEQTRAYLGAAPVTKMSWGSERHSKRRAVSLHGRTPSTTSPPLSPPIPPSNGKESLQSPRPQARPLSQNPRGSTPPHLLCYAA